MRQWNKASKPWSLDLHEGVPRHRPTLRGKNAMISSLHQQPPAPPLLPVAFVWAHEREMAREYSQHSSTAGLTR